MGTKSSTENEPSLFRLLYSEEDDSATQFAAIIYQFLPGSLIISRKKVSCQIGSRVCRFN